MTYPWQLWRVSCLLSRGGTTDPPSLRSCTWTPWGNSSDLKGEIFVTRNITEIIQTVLYNSMGEYSRNIHHWVYIVRRVMKIMCQGKADHNCSRLHSLMLEKIMARNPPKQLKLNYGIRWPKMNLYCITYLLAGIRFQYNCATYE